jgi:hypothetical protein
MCARRQMKIKLWFQSVGKLSMQKVNEFRFYELASIIHPLTTASDQLKYSDIWLDWHTAGESLDQIFQQRSLEFCFAAANELYAAIAGVVPANFSEAVERFEGRGDPEDVLGWARVHPIRAAAAKFETILSAELSNSDTYWIHRKAPIGPQCS